MIGIIWAIAYFIVFGLPMLLIPKAVRKTNKFMNKCTLENDLYKFISEHKNWSYVVIHFKGENETAKAVTVYSNQKRLIQLEGRCTVENYLSRAYKLDIDVKNAILDNYSDSYNLHNNGYKNLDVANAKKIAKVLAMRLCGQMEVVEGSTYTPGVGFYTTHEGRLAYDNGDSEHYTQFVIIYSKDKCKEKQEKRKQERYVRGERGYKGY